MSRYRRKLIPRSPGKREEETSAGFEDLFTLLAVAGLISGIFWVINYLNVAWHKGNKSLVISCIVSVAMIILLYLYAAISNLMTKEEALKDLKKKITLAKVSDDRQDYIIEDNDYRRGNAKENHYRRSHHLSLLAKYGNSCAKCGRSDNGIDIDHFFLSKNEGGCFILRHREGHLINNAIPLCISCNRSKSDHSYKDFFNTEELLRLFTKNAEMTVSLNSQPLLDQDGKILKKTKNT